MASTVYDVELRTKALLCASVVCSGSSRIAKEVIDKAVEFEKYLRDGKR